MKLENPLQIKPFKKRRARLAKGLANGVVARVWNHATAASAMQLTAATGPFASARRLTHLETTKLILTPIGGALADTIAGQKMETYAFTPTPLTAFEAWKIQRASRLACATVWGI